MTAVDNLNRTTTISGVNRTYDILGNTLTIGSTKSMTWDSLNRMLSYTSGSTTTDYQYRADGMRTKKIGASTTNWFYYDGQMPIETAEVGSSSTVVTRNGFGARGIDRIERVGTSTTVGYPIYDAHGNMVATLAKSGSSYSLGDQRSYDAWGVIRSGNTSGDPKGRYCANLGHIDDDESGLTYMRARYYEASSGRFVSEDSQFDGIHWYIYCSNRPTTGFDFSGKNWIDQLLAGVGSVFWLRGMFHFLGTVLSVVALTITVGAERALLIKIAVEQATLAITYFSIALEGGEPRGVGTSVAILANQPKVQAIIGSIVEGMNQGKNSSAAIAVFAIGAYSMAVLAALICTLTTGEPPF